MMDHAYICNLDLYDNERCWAESTSYWMSTSFLVSWLLYAMLRIRRDWQIQPIQKTDRRVLSTFNISTKHISSEDENSLAVAGISLALKTKYDMNGNQIVCQHSKHHQWRCDFKCCEGDICWSYSKTSTMIAVHMQYTEQSEARSKMQDYSNIHLARSNIHLQDSYWYAARGKYKQMKMPFNVVRPSSCKSGFHQYSGQLVENIVDQEATSVCEGALHQLRVVLVTCPYQLP